MSENTMHGAASAAHEKERLARAAHEALVQAEMEKLMTRECPECQQPKVFYPWYKDYVCEDCRKRIDCD